MSENRAFYHYLESTKNIQDKLSKCKICNRKPHFLQPHSPLGFYDKKTHETTFSLACDCHNYLSFTSYFGHDGAELIEVDLTTEILCILAKQWEAIQSCS